MSSRVNDLLKVILNNFEKLNIENRNKETLILSGVVGFALFSRIIPFSFVTLITLVFVILVIATDFYFYTNRTSREENKNEKVLEYSWGYVKEKTSHLDINTLVKYLSSKDFAFYKNYFTINHNKIILLLFVFGDIIVAFKNLDFFNSGIYIAMSIFTKFVFLGYIFMRDTYNKILVGENNSEENILDIFYSQINGLLSAFIVIFLLFFALSKYLVEIFFGKDYLPYQSSLPFVLFANIALVVAICVYMTSKRIDPQLTGKISKIFATIFGVIFIFMSINYIDTVTYFVIGTSCLLSIFLYNFVIKKPQYIANTYNHLF